MLAMHQRRRLHLEFGGVDGKENKKEYNEKRMPRLWVGGAGNFRGRALTVRPGPAVTGRTHEFFVVCSSE